MDTEEVPTMNLLFPLDCPEKPECDGEIGEFIREVALRDYGGRTWMRALKVYTIKMNETINHTSKEEIYGSYKYRTW